MIETIKQQMQRLWRQRRMLAFLERMGPRSEAKVIDLGGTPDVWEMIDLDLDITLLNQPDEWKNWSGSFKRRYKFVEADACDAAGFANNDFDLVFSNSVVEHVGPPERQEAFARTVGRLAPSYWIQTPSVYFPIEAHCNLPFWWFYPPRLKQAWICRWQLQGREFLWKQMTETQVLSLSQLKSLFPGALVYTEYVAGFPKSYSMYSKRSKG